MSEVGATGISIHHPAFNMPVNSLPLEPPSAHEKGPPCRKRQDGLRTFDHWIAWG
jgi:hypothetical protein